MAQEHLLARRPQVTVIGNSEASSAATQAAEQVGCMLARLGCTVITGGGAGVMEAVSRGVRLAGGGPTIGILPGSSLRDGNAYLDVVIPTGAGYARNMTNVLSADVVIVIGGATGTLSEMAFAWMFDKPVVALCGHGGWADKLAGERLDERRDDTVRRASTIEELEAIVREFISSAHRVRTPHAQRIV